MLVETPWGWNYEIKSKHDEMFWMYYAYRNIMRKVLRKRVETC